MREGQTTEDHNQKKKDSAKEVTHSREMTHSRQVPSSRLKFRD